MKYENPLRALSIILHSWIAAFLVPVILGCGQTSDDALVDFSNKIEVESPNIEQDTANTLKVAVAAMISPKETIRNYKSLLDYMAVKLEFPIQLIQRKTYREINELFEKHQIDLAFICTGPYVELRNRLGIEGLATPIVRGSPYYQSYLIVNKDSPFQSFEDLRSHRFAFTDPDSNTGSLVPHYWLATMDQRTPSFFSEFTYTYSHDNSIMAVARGLVDGATVDGHKWEYFNIYNPRYTRLTKVIKKSGPFGNPPLVAAIELAPEMKTAIQKALFAMHQDADGKHILDQLLIDRFETPQEAWYEPVREMYLKVQSANGETIPENMAPHS